jgi:cell division protein FtsB
MRSEQRKSKLTLYIILSLAFIIAISSFIYAAKSKHQLTEVTSQLEYAASNNEEASNERINELEAEIESLSQQLDEAQQPQPETKAATDSKDTEPAKEVTKQETTPTKSEPIQPESTELSKEEARQIVIDFAQVRNNDNLKTQYDHDEGNDYIFQVYEVVADDAENSHTATFGWYGVNKLTGDVYDTME